MDALLVEDSPTARAQLRQALVRRGHLVTAVADAEAAWSLCHDAEYPLIILDWVLPGMDGLELCRQIRALPWGEAAVILLTTAREGPDELHHALEAGVSDYLPKSAGLAAIDVRLAVAERQAVELARRRHAEGILEESEARFRALTEHASDLVSILAADGSALYESPSYERALGLPLAALQRQLGSPLQVIHPDDRSAIQNAFRQLLGGASTTALIARHRRADGTWRTLESLATNHLDDPAIRGIISTSRDVTERMAAEVALAESEARLRAVTASAPIILFTLDATGVFTLVEGRGLGSLHVAPEALVGLSVFDLFADDPVALSGFRAALAGQTVTFSQDIGGVVFEHRLAPLGDARGGHAETIGVAIDLSARIAAERALRRSEETVRTLVETATVGICITDDRGIFEEVNAAYCALYGYAPEELIGQRFTLIFPTEAREAAAARHDRRTSYEESGVQREFRVMRRDGQIRTVLSTSVPLVGADDQPKRVSFVVDITDRSRMEEAVRRSERHLALQYGATRILAEAGTLEAALPPLLRAIGAGLGWQATGFWLPDIAAGRLRFAEGWCEGTPDHAEFVTRSKQIAFGPGQGQPGQVWVRGTPVWVADVLADPTFQRTDLAAAAGLHTGVFLPVLVGGTAHGVLECFSAEALPPDPELLAALTAIGSQVGQLVDRLRATEALRYQALHDTLSGLPNRALLADRLELALATTARTGAGLALFLLDLNRFKAVNDTYGHHVGDRLLQEVATRIQSTLRASDTVARLGGDEFAVLLPDTDLIGAMAAARAIHAAITLPIVVQGQPLDVGASIGISMAPGDATEGEELLRMADQAMYAAKRAGGGSVAYDAETDEGNSHRKALAAELREALAADALALHYQPQLDLATGRAVGVEALLRWPHPRHGLLPGGRFLSLADSPELSLAVARWVLDAALRQHSTWRRELREEIELAVNLSPQALADPQLPSTVAWLLRSHAVPPACLALEITEDTIAADPLAVGERLAALAALGVRIVLDDVGTGLLSLAALQRLPLSALKIDTQFMPRLPDQPGQEAIVRTIIQMGHSLGLHAVAEGIEDSGTLERLRALGCDRGQGYYLARPLPADDVATWWRADR